MYFVRLVLVVLVAFSWVYGNEYWNMEENIWPAGLSEEKAVLPKTAEVVDGQFSAAALSNPDGDLRIEVITARNLIVDSNVESPSTYAPESFHAGVKFCNDGTDTLWSVWMNIGDFTAGMPGLYPSRTHSGLTGTFSFTHQGGSAGVSDATRFIPYIAPGECFNQFWLLGYPRLDDDGNSVTQGIKPDDDLWLEFDVWATADDNGTPLAADDSRTMFMRNEISAMANKIWPNGDNKVPNEYKEAIEETLGWSIQSSSGNPEATVYKS